jgi:2-amino-4-hydroxy-6-hydroxymethyldihydropteridine diphosphokinase
MQQNGTQSEIVALALGSNLGDRLSIMRAAVAALKPYVMVNHISAVYETPPAYVADQPVYLNAAVLGSTRLAPPDLLNVLKQIETALGRKESFRYGPRLIDIDILFYGEQRMATPELTLPHPRLAEREFVLRPLADVAGTWRHPTTGMTINDMLAALPEHTARRCEEKL